MLTKRSIASVVIFSILTCGIYMLWWTYVTCTALQQQGRKTAIPPALTVFLMLFCRPAGGALLGIDANDNLNAIKRANKMTETNNQILWIVLGVIVPIAVVWLVQHEINQMIDMAQRAYNSYAGYNQNPYAGYGQGQPPYGQQQNGDQYGGNA